MPRFDPSSTASGRELFPRAGDAVATIHVPTSALFYEAAIEGLTRLDEAMLEAAFEADTPFPSIYESGVGYRKEAEDTWRHADDVLCSGWGDCEDLAAWRAAELRVYGIDPNARVYVYKSGPRRFHAVVARGNGRIEDPSVLLGMRVSAARRAQLPQWEGESEMEDNQARPFAVCTGTCNGCPNHAAHAAGIDNLSYGSVGDPGAPLLSDGTSGMFGRLSRSFARGVSRVARPRIMPRLSPFMAAGYDQRDDGSGQSMLGVIDDGRGDIVGEDPYYDDYGSDYPADEGQYDDYGEYPEEAAPAEQPPPPSGPDAAERAMNAVGRGIKSAASSIYSTGKDIVSPLYYAGKLATAPISLVAQASKKAYKYANAPIAAAKKIFSFLGGVDEVHPSMVGYIDDPEYADGDEDELADLFDEHYADSGIDAADVDAIAEEIPPSQKARFRTAEVAPGVWQGQVVLPTKDAGKSFTLTSSPAPDEKSAAERMYNLASKASQTPAMMAMLNPVAFLTLMTLRGAGKVPFGNIFSKVGSGVATAARAIGRSAESIAQTATEW